VYKAEEELMKLFAENTSNYTKRQELDELLSKELANSLRAILWNIRSIAQNSTDIQRMMADADTRLNVCSAIDNEVSAIEERIQVHLQFKEALVALRTELLSPQK